jgi:hypothetical protein
MNIILVYFNDSLMPVFSIGIDFNLIKYLLVVLRLIISGYLIFELDFNINKRIINVIIS